MLTQVQRSMKQGDTHHIGKQLYRGRYPVYTEVPMSPGSLVMVMKKVAKGIPFVRIRN